jgi:hypothetical protein
MSELASDSNTGSVSGMVAIQRAGRGPLTGGGKMGGIRVLRSAAEDAG